MNKSKLIIVLLISAIILMLSGATYAYYRWQSTGAQNTLVTFTITAGFTCSADGGGNITSNDVKLAPAKCTDSQYAIKRTVTTNATINDSPASMNLWLNVDHIDSALANSANFKYALTTSASSCTDGVQSSGTFTGKNDTDTVDILTDKKYTQTGSNTYYLYIWLDEAEENINTMNKTFSFSIGGECTKTEVLGLPTQITENSIMDNVKSEFVSATTGINFNSVSSDTNGKGLYIRAGTENDAYPIYYYRGAVTNNNVLFANYCWKIVRTTDTGGIKLIYNGTPTGTNNNICNNTGSNSELQSTIVFNANGTSPADVGYMTGIRYETMSKQMTSITDTYMYGTGYDETIHKLVTTNMMSFAGTDWANNYNNLNNNHYTCFNTTGECTEINYIYYTDDENAYYVTIPSGKTISSVLDEMLTSSSNANNSTIKMRVDTWYQNNMTSYTDKLEDTPWCNDRTIYQLNGWDPNGGDTTKYLYFGAFGRALSTYPPSLTCNKNDAFTLPSNVAGNGKLTHPFGFLTVDEIRLGGGRFGMPNSSYYLNTGVEWWVGSPYSFSYNSAEEFEVMQNGMLLARYMSYINGVRPAVSLKLGTKFSSGDGSYTDPYVVE